MYEITVSTTFSAAHAIVIRGEREPLHGHDWRVEAVLAGPELDEDSLLVDFHLVEGILSGIVKPFRNANLNDVPPFDKQNPSAEGVARHIADSLAARLGSALDGGGVRVASVRVTEAPGCSATYRPTTPGT